MTADVDSRAARPAVSVLIPAYGHVPHLPTLLARLATQTSPPAEVIVVHSGPGDPRGTLTPGPGVRILHYDGRLYAGAARNRALAEARHDWIACIDADVLPEPDWLAALLGAALARPDRFVVGAVASAGTGGYWGTALWAIEFSSVHPYLPDRPIKGGAGANMLARRRMLEEAGGFPEDFRAAEDTVLNARLRRLGLENWFCAAARVRHFDLPGARHFARHLLMHGRWFVAARRRERMAGSILVRLWPVLPALGPIRFAQCAARALRWGRGYRLKFAILTPAVLAGCLLWATGATLGLVMPAGKAPRASNAAPAAGDEPRRPAA